MNQYPIAQIRRSDIDIINIFSTKHYCRLIVATEMFSLNYKRVDKEVKATRQIHSAKDSHTTRQLMNQLITLTKLSQLNSSYL